MRFNLSLLLVAVCTASGCGPSGDELNRRAYARGSLLMNGIMHYVTENKGLLPETIEQVMPFFNSEEQFRIAMTNPFTGVSPGWEYVRPAEKLVRVNNPSSVPVLYQLTEGKRAEKGKGLIGYADGHIEPELKKRLTEEDYRPLRE